MRLLIYGLRAGRRKGDRIMSNNLEKRVYEYVVVDYEEETGTYTDIVGDGRVLARGSQEAKMIVAASLGLDGLKGRFVLVRPFCSD